MSGMPSTLPNEVVYRVFEDYATDDKDRQLLFTLRWTKLLLVCRQWRDVGLTAPKFWSFVNFETFVLEIPASSWKGPNNFMGPIIDDQTLLATKLEADFRRLTTQLARAKQQPLTVKIRSNFWIQQIIKDIEDHPTLQSIRALQQAVFSEPRAFITRGLTLEVEHGGDSRLAREGVAYTL